MKTTIHTLAGISLLVICSVATADDIKFGEETLDFSAGMFLQNFDTNVTVKDLESGIGGDINLEDTLGYDDSDDSGYLNLTWRFASKHRIGISYFNSERKVEAIALDDIDLGEGDIISAGAGFSSEFNVQVLPVEYSYSFINNDKQELYGTIGLHWYAIDYSVLAAAGIDEDVFEANIDVEADAPMPLIGAGWDYYLNDRWKIALQAQGFYIKLSEDTFSFEGSIINAGVSTEYYLWNNIGIGASLSYFKMDIDIDDSDWNGSIDYSYWGPSAYIKARF